jgi:hypothetical protein
MRNVRTKIEGTFQQVDDDDDRAQERHSRGAITVLRLFRRPQARAVVASLHMANNISHRPKHAVPQICPIATT